MEIDHANRASETPAAAPSGWTRDKWESEQARLDYLRARKRAFDQAKAERVEAGLESYAIFAPRKRRKKKAKKKKRGSGGGSVMGSFSLRSSGQKFGW